MIVRHLARSLFTVLVAVAVLSLPVIAIYASNLANRTDAPADVAADAPADPAPAQLVPAAPLSATEEQPVTTEHHRDDHRQGAGCRGLQMAYWRLSSNRGQGEGKQEALDKVVAKADERGCTLAEGDELSEDGPPWGPPPWAGKDDEEDERGEGRGPRWSRDGDDGPPRGLAWGHWLKHGGEDVCERIAERLAAKPNAQVPEDLRGRIHDELGCSLP